MDNATADLELADLGAIEMECRDNGLSSASAVHDSLVTTDDPSSVDSQLEKAGYEFKHESGDTSFWKLDPRTVETRAVKAGDEIYVCGKTYEVKGDGVLLELR